MRLVGLGLESGFSLWRVVACGETCGAVAEPRASAIPAKVAKAASGVFAGWLGLVGAGHNSDIVRV
jgi:hypothetical protein